MIDEFRDALEELLEFPIHYVNVIDPSVFPLGSLAIRQMTTGPSLGSGAMSQRREISVLITMYDTDYTMLNDYAELILDTFDGQATLLDTVEIYKCWLEDLEDESFPPIDGSNNWIYCKLLTLKFSYKKQ